jgi:hypothetical protein
MEERLISWLAAAPELIRMLLRSYGETRLFWDSLDNRPVLVASADTIKVFRRVGHLAPSLKYSVWSSSECR